MNFRTVKVIAIPKKLLYHHIKKRRKKGERGRGSKPKRRKKAKDLQKKGRKQVNRNISFLLFMYACS